MKNYIIFLFLFISISVFAKTTIEQANDAYAANNFSKAIQLYEKTIDEKGISAAVYYNLGNACYRLNKIASSILNYERSILIDPKNEDVHFNLEIARSKTIDKINPIETSFWTKVYNATKNLYNINQWGSIGISCFLLFIACLFFFRKPPFKKIGFYLGSISLILCVFANLSAYNQKKCSIQHNTAIIFAPTITIKSSPNNNSTDLFILHEGSKVSIKNKLGEWDEIETISGNRGWIKNKEIEII